MKILCKKGEKNWIAKISLNSEKNMEFNFLNSSRTVSAGEDTFYRIYDDVENGFYAYKDQSTNGKTQFGEIKNKVFTNMTNRDVENILLLQ